MNRVTHEITYLIRIKKTCLSIQYPKNIKIIRTSTSIYIETIHFNENLNL